jgi:aerobic carbon-monoxide dehydrogenase medium subunit
VRDFEFLEPRSVDEASRMLADHEEGRLFAGGTALLLAMRQRMLTPSHIVYLAGVRGLNSIERDSNGLRIGALVSHAEIADSALVKAACPMLADMAGRVANPQVRNVGTLGGNLCYADPSTDPPTCLMALNAQILVSGGGGERTIEIDRFFTDYFQTALEIGDVVTEIRVPALGPGVVGAYTRFLRTPADHRPLVGVGIVARRSGDVCEDVRIAIGASVPMPVRARRAEDFLAGKTISEEVVREAAEIAAADITPISDFRGSEHYRRDMVRTVVQRTAASLFA